VQYLPQQPDTAISTARQWAANNGIPSSEIQSVTVTTTNYANDTLTVRLNKSFGWIFGRVLGKTTSPVGARAGAVVGSLGGNNNMMPWALLEGNTNCLDADGDAIYGSTCSVKVGAAGGILGWYGALDFDGNGGGSAEYKANIIDGTTNTRYCIAGDPSPGCVSAVPVVDALDGNKVGPTDQGIDTRIAQGGTACDTDSSGKDDFDEVFQDNPGPGATYTVACNSPRLVIIPIVSYSGTPPVQTVTIRGWSLAYLDTYWCVAGGGGSTCNGNGHWEVQVKLVDAVYAQATGFITAYNEDGAITVRRLVQ
jgi:hypothetical protein